MTAELTEAEVAVVARFAAAEPAPESFDPIAALRRVEALADKWSQRYSTEMRQRTRALREALDGTP